MPQKHRNRSRRSIPGFSYNSEKIYSYSCCLCIDYHQILYVMLPLFGTDGQLLCYLHDFSSKQLPHFWTICFLIQESIYCIKIRCKGL